MSLTVLVAHPSPDVYGADLQLVESVRGLVDAGHRVVVAVPGSGPLVPLLRERGAEVTTTLVPVLRKSMLNPVGLARLALAGTRGIVDAVRVLRRVRPDVVYVNTVTVPLWLVAARMVRVPALCHVHEAEADAGRLLGAALVGPLLLARRVMVNSAAALAVIRRTSERAARRSRVVYNGVPGPPTGAETDSEVPGHVVVVGRLSPRKGTDVALEAVAELRRDGLGTTLELCGSTATGYEWYEQQLRERAAAADLEGAVTFGGYVSPTWPALARAQVVVVPSRVEPFGNTAVEAQLAARALVASRVGGLQEIVTHEVDGLLVEPDDPAALAAAVRRLLTEERVRRELASTAATRAHERFGTERYDRDVLEVVDEVATLSRR